MEAANEENNKEYAKTIVNTTNLVVFIQSYQFAILNRYGQSIQLKCSILR
jgi:hypothetical protein